jgi:hypothetical protein
VWQRGPQLDHCLEGLLVDGLVVACGGDSYHLPGGSSSESPGGLSGPGRGTDGP